MIDLDSVAFRGATFDSRAVKPGMLFVALKGGKADGHDYIPQALAAGAAGVVDGLAELQALARERRRRLKATVVGVTGSAGKTTTKEFLKAFLACPGTDGNFNNHIGLPMTILNCPEDAAFLVLEMGTNHPGEIAALCEIAAPDVGAICSVGTAHLEFFGTQEAIAREKGALFASARRFNAVPANVNQLAVLKSLSRVELVEADPADAALPACPLPGPHNLSDMAVAWAVARRLGVTAAACAARLARFALPGARWRRFERRGVGFIDDSYNANPDSMVAALEAFAQEPCRGRRIAVLGDMFELGPESPELHRRVFEKARALGLPLVIGVGEASSQCACHLAFRDLAALKRRFACEVARGDLVLLKGSHAMHLTELADF